MSGKEQEPSIITVPPPNNFSIKSTVFQNIISITTTTTTTEESNDVWYPISFRENSSFYFKKYDDYLFLPNYSLASNFSFNVSENRTFHFYPHDETIKIMTMIGIAVLLGFIILATVIGKRKILFYFIVIQSALKASTLKNFEKLLFIYI